MCVLEFYLLVLKIHAFTQFFHVFGGSVSVGWCVFLCLGNNKLFLDDSGRLVRLYAG